MGYLGQYNDRSQDNIRLGLAHPTERVPVNFFGRRFSTARPYTTDELAENLARMKMYHADDFDKRMGFIDNEIKRRYVPAYRSGKRGRHYHPAQDNGAFIRTAYNNAFKSRTWLDAMRNFELRQKHPDRYIPASFESLQNIDIYAERGKALQKRNILGRRREQTENNL